MIAEVAQAAVEAAKSSTITGQFVLDGALLIAGLKVAEAGIAKFKSRNGNGTKPGTSAECLKHRDELTALKTEQANTKEDIAEVKLDVKELLRRVPPK
jgi:hypothetical protein